MEKSKIVDAFIAKYGRLPTEFDKDYLEMLNMSKYRILDNPHYKPSKCANCGSPKVDGRKYIDFGLEIDWFGIVYLCTLCLNDINDKVGMYKPFVKKIEKLEAELLERYEQIADLKKKLKSFEEDLNVKYPNAEPELLEALKELNEYNRNNKSSSTDSVPDWDSSVDTDKAETKPVSREDNSKPTGTNPRVTKSATGTRRTDVPSLDKILNL